ncbi:28 kDa golgi family snare protein [Trichosporon asahii var. asahii CBS 2479]|uniref:Golgi SNAP receptor complex member 1 n=1 Tax=Trichosporon asahii var. asahii (strain ATCC 90039 / CBS 2479 / JCM 2466 / KCTC 7840 / NBRC 103889/ NCYC 2677 / UAMH 7654) TaxID=1186058 RepID=J4U5J9_TRIAS|nr:28 kDa golgi family snare protein [Trichosporon asahii var. asahii CBS 2479]EJT45280.1 28 kDa golgi family snare protein [Trichosporon asahii var. asahii CBS 2479]
MSTWDNAIRHTRALESALDTKLSNYSRIGADIAGGGGVSGVEAAEEGVGGYRLVEEEVEELLDKALSDLSSHCNGPTPPSTSMQNALSRHRSNLDDYRRDYTRIKRNIESALAKSDLLGSVRRDIDSCKAARASQTEALLADRDHIDASHRMIDEITATAQATRQAFFEDSATIRNINARMGRVANQIPGINKLIAAIGTRRRRDQYIIAGVAAACILFLLWYMFG